MCVNMVRECPSCYQGVGCKHGTHDRPYSISAISRQWGVFRRRCAVVEVIEERMLAARQLVPSQ